MLCSSLLCVSQNLGKAFGRTQKRLLLFYSDQARISDDDFDLFIGWIKIVRFEKGRSRVATSFNRTLSVGFA